MSMRVLVVDDELSVCEALREVLDIKGYRVSVAQSGCEALASYRRERPDVVLLDVRMPGMSGLDVLREIRAFDPEALVVMVTAVSDRKVIEEAFAAGASGYVKKPVDVSYLVSVLKAKLASSEEEGWQVQEMEEGPEESIPGITS